MPLYAGIRLSLERNDSNLDLLYITTIRPGAIVRGKYFASLALTLLIFSACMPFIVFTYLLRGVNLVSIFWILLFGFLACTVADALGIFAGAMGGNWILRRIGRPRAAGLSASFDGRLCRACFGAW